MGDINRINRLAARQHGVFSGSQARSAGFDKHAVARKLASGDWRQLDYRVFALAAAAPTWERQLWVALLSRPRAVVGGQSAAFLHRFKGFAQAKPTIVVPGSSNARSTIARVIRAEHYDDLLVDRVRGFPVISVPETLLSLGGGIASIRFEQLFDELLLSGRLDLNKLEAVVDREQKRRRRGIVLLRHLLDDRKPTAPSHDSSYLEALLERVLTKARLPVWTREYPFSLGGKPCRVDLYIADWKLVIEADGRNWHARMQGFEEDRRRDNELATRGIQVIRLTYRMLKSDPEDCLETIRAVGRVRSA
jgi:very-short-patch-repair endonuclease